MTAGGRHDDIVRSGILPLTASRQRATANQPPDDSPERSSCCRHPRTGIRPAPPTSTAPTLPALYRRHERMLPLFEIMQDVPFWKIMRTTARPIRVEETAAVELPR